MKEQFRTGVMSLGGDPTTAQLVIEAYPLSEVEEDDDGFLADEDDESDDAEEVLRVKMPVGTARAFAKRTPVVDKPIAGEQPLWDFPDGCLAHREAAAYLVSEVLGGNRAPVRRGPRVGFPSRAQGADRTVGWTGEALSATRWRFTCLRPDTGAGP